MSSTQKPAKINNRLVFLRVKIERSPKFRNTTSLPSLYGATLNQPRLEEDQVEEEDDSLAPPPKAGRRSSGRPSDRPHRSLDGGGRSSGRPHRSVLSGSGGWGAALSPLRLNLGTYFPGAGAAAAAAGAGTGSDGRAPETGSAGLVGKSDVLPRRASLLCLSLSSNSLSLCLCFSAISSSFAFRSASSFFFLSASAINSKT